MADLQILKDIIFIHPADLEDLDLGEIGCRELILRGVEKLLNGIKKANGYNNNEAFVERQHNNFEELPDHSILVTDLGADYEQKIGGVLVTLDVEIAGVVVDDEEQPEETLDTKLKNFLRDTLIALDLNGRENKLWCSITIENDRLTSNILYPMGAFVIPAKILFTVDRIAEI